MYHSAVNSKDAKTVGRSAASDLMLEHGSVSRHHATVEVTREGYLAVQDSHSRNGTFLNRNGRWVRARRVILGTRDRIRFGDLELPLDVLIGLFTPDDRVRLREGYSVRGKPLMFDRLLAGLPRPRTVFENPRRNPLTGDIEERRKP